MLVSPDRTAIAATAGCDPDQDTYRRSLLAALQFREQRSQSVMDADEALGLNEVFGLIGLESLVVVSCDRVLFR